MSCIKAGNIRCTSCCEAIYISKPEYQKYLKGTINCDDVPLLFGKAGAWTPISYRRAIKINPYMNNNLRVWSKEKKTRHTMQYFTCKYVVKG